MPVDLANLDSPYLCDMPTQTVESLEGIDETDCPGARHVNGTRHLDIPRSYLQQTSSTSSSGLGTSDYDSHSDSLHDSVSDGEHEAESGIDERTGFTNMLQRQLFGFGRRNCNNKATQTYRDPVESKAETLALDVVFYVIGKRSEKTEDKVLRSLRRCVDEVLQKHVFLFNGMVHRLQIQPETGYETFVTVANELFENGHVTWGRIVTLYAFGARLGMYCVEKGMESFAIEIAHFMGRYAAENVSSFVRAEGGWEALCDHFPVDEGLENKVWKCLLGLGLGLGVAATATFIASH